MALIFLINKKKKPRLSTLKAVVISFANRSPGFWKPSNVRSLSRFLICYDWVPRPQVSYRQVPFSVFISAQQVPDEQLDWPGGIEHYRPTKSLAQSLLNKFTNFFLRQLLFTNRYLLEFQSSTR